MFSGKVGRVMVRLLFALILGLVLLGVVSCTGSVKVAWNADLKQPVAFGSRGVDRVDAQKGG